MDIKDKKMFSEKWFAYLQTQICKDFEDLEKKANSNKKFISTNWQKKKVSEGGGTYKILKDGKIFDKGGGNKSTVSGVFSA